ncbi:lectin precursor, putative [Talaromyces stipitatus ATCC 10500]|uniref:Lectin, putative n=1 Tax=Talaromyces stipitatus (strain ATCC 10500 / CBS 375.48 / QM 6759 / NRRL 1006) TaxID=441959 RepID=B8MF64_TALSN|nr:lectin precursor, putative [Talaromyces stipitatus ATCC 10500]EED16163.1 lectin precursor, putative [Talaromyces stipitatus ATCC 10500]
MASISTDGNCGSNSKTNSTCLGSTYGDCCSAKGYCGGTSDYCGGGCQSAFGNSTAGAMNPTKASSTTASASTSTTTGTVSEDGNCGSNSAVFATCLGSEWGNCCSSHGFCGGNISYCSAGCQSEFGNCGLAAMTTNTTSNSDSSSGHLGAGAIAGISVGSAIGGLALVAVLVWLAFFRTKKKIKYSVRIEDELKPYPPSKPFVDSHELDGHGNLKHEIDGRGGYVRQELDTRMISELPAEPGHK